MGLGFHIGQGGIDNLGESLGQIEMDELYWLQQNGFIKPGETGHFPDSIKSFPYFEDVVLTHQQVIEVKVLFDSRKNAPIQIYGQKKQAIETMDNILKRASTLGLGLCTLAD